MPTASEIVQAMYDKQPLVFGHRGAMAYAPMNTLAAFELAAKQGADGIELDVHRSRDGYPVIVHDFTVDATSNGTGQVTEMTLAELKALDVGTWFSSSFVGAQVPTLDEVFEAVGQRLLINVEIKVLSPDTDGVEQVVADCIARHSMQRRVIVSSFNPPTLKRFRALMPDVPMGFLYYPGAPVDTRPMVADLAYEAYHPYHAIIDAAVMDRARQNGHFVNTWTVNEAQEALRLHDLGVHGIITNAPDRIIETLA